MTFLDSTYVKVYPSTRRTIGKQFDARPITEFQLVSIVNRLIDKDSFVITKPSALDLNGYIEFNIRGYYFKVNVSQVIATVTKVKSTAQVIYAHIWIDNTSQMQELFGQDNEDVYEGIEFSDTQTVTVPTGDTRANLPQYYCRILEKDSSGSWVIPDISVPRFTGDMVSAIAPEKLDFTTIDGGDLDN